ncbi:MAG: squalene/phytoene synthase family protein, partial [Hyphomicrobiaceae bacterium]
YYAALLAGEPQRAALLAIAAFSAELRHIPFAVKEPVMGEIRLQWWRDTLEQLQLGAVVGHPIADGLGRAIAAYQLPLPMLHAMTEARAFDLYADPMPDEASLEGYLSKTEATAFALALRVLGVSAERADALANPAGRAFGLARMLARVPEYAARGKLLLPQSRLDAADVSAVDILAGRGGAGVRRLFTQGCADIERAGAAVWPQMALLSRSERVAVLPLAVLSAYTTAMGRPNASSLRRPIEVSPWARVVGIGMAHYLGRFRARGS